MLLILAGVSISMLSGDNSILQRATEAKGNTERASVVEQARTDVLGYQINNKGEDLDETQLKSVLDKYFQDVPTELPDGNELLNLELTTLEKYGIHAIKVSEIYNGNLVRSNTNTKLTAIVQSSDYGKSIDYSVTVSGTTLNNWKVFLNDGNNVYIILADSLPGGLGPDLGGYPVSHSTVNGVELYETDWDSYEVLTGLGNQSYFVDFVDNNVAVSATGAPTLEQLSASYGVEELTIGTALTGDLYVISNEWWLVPENPSTGNEVIASGGILANYWPHNLRASIRPLVKLSSDATGSVDSTVTIDE